VSAIKVEDTLGRIFMTIQLSIVMDFGCEEISHVAELEAFNHMDLLEPRILYRLGLHPVYIFHLENAYRTLRLSLARLCAQGVTDEAAC
jgi:hypothetical protein